MIRLKKSKAFVFTGRLKYLIAYDHASGKRERYTVLVLSSKEPITIGRELDLPFIRELIQYYEDNAPNDWLGGRVHLERIVAEIQMKRKKEFL